MGASQWGQSLDEKGGFLGGQKQKKPLINSGFSMNNGVADGI